MQIAKRPDLTKLLLHRRDRDIPTWVIALLTFLDDASSEEAAFLAAAQVLKDGKPIARERSWSPENGSDVRSRCADTMTSC